MPDADLGFLLVFVAVLVWMFPRTKRKFGEDRRKLVAKHARRIRRQLDAVHSGAHVYREVELTSVKKLDYAWYDAQRAELEQKGFVWMRDVVDETATRAWAGSRSCIRAMLGDNGRVGAALNHVRVGGWMRLAAAATRVPRDLRVIEFNTELTDGRWILTANLKDWPRLPFHPEWVLDFLPADADGGEMLERHRRSVQVALARDPHLQVVVRRTPADMESAAHRIWEALSRAYRAKGCLTPEEWKAFIGRENKTTNEIYAELRALLRAEAAGREPRAADTAGAARGS